VTRGAERRFRAPRVIRTARDAASINEAARAGFRPLVKTVEPSDDIRTKFAVLQDRTTGEIEVICDYRDLHDPERYERVIDWTYYYPDTFPSPFAAYLVPPDIEVGEEVLLDDLIEDHVGMRWNQGDNYRLGSCRAIWTGTDFELILDPTDDVIIG